MDIVENYYGIPVEKWHVNGSLACNNQGNDIDIVVLCSKGYLATNPLLNGWDNCSTYEISTEDDYRIMRKGDINLICMEDPRLYVKWERALALSWALNAERKPDRQCIYRVVVDGLPPL